MKKKKKLSIKSMRLDYPALRSAIIRYHKRFPQKKLDTKSVLKKLKVRNSTEEAEQVMEKLVKQGVLFKFRNGKYVLARQGQEQSRGYREMEGIIDSIRSGAAYLIVEGQAEDVYIPSKNLKNALDGDTVRARVRTRIQSKRGNKKPVGEVVEVLKRANDQFIGTIYPFKKRWVVVPDSPLINFDILINEDPELDVNEFDKAVVQVYDWNTGRMPHGRIISILDTDDSNDYAMNSILINKGFPMLFPERVIRECEEISKKITEVEINKRRDCRDILTITIDPETAKDFDDALSIQWLNNGEVEVGIHIADVTHYVRPGTTLDQEAYKRSTSVYLVDRVSPMLPEVLSNDLCSLNPNEDKLTFSAIFTFDKNRKITSQWFGKTIIHSDQRFTYEEAQQRLDEKTGSYHEELIALNKIAGVLRKSNVKHGAIQFDSDEVQFELDEKGKPIGMKIKERKDAHLLIEDFMLLANKQVATFISKKGKDHEIPFVYRIHDLPDVDKVHEFSKFAMELGFEMRTQTPREIADSFNRLQEAALEDPALRILSPLAIRSMAKAAYSSYNIGHYGLGFENYTHFTSPIRRYADVLVHRILEKNLSKDTRVKKIALEDKCKHISALERKAIEAERESKDYKRVEYIKEHIGDVFIGLVSGMIDRGMFVQLIDSGCEGLVNFSSLGESFSIADHGFKAMGIHTGKVYKFGDQVKVRIMDADLEKREIDMEIVEEIVL